MQSELHRGRQARDRARPDSAHGEQLVLSTVGARGSSLAARRPIGASGAWKAHQIDREQFDDPSTSIMELNDPR